MMSATVVSGGAASSGYYRAEGYYAADSEVAAAASQWFGKAAEELGLRGQVDDALFTSMLVVDADGLPEGRALYSIPELVAGADGPQHAIAAGDTGGTIIRFRIVDRDRQVVTVSTEPEEALRSVRTVYWFAWSAVEAERP